MPWMLASFLTFLKDLAPSRRIPPGGDGYLRRSMIPQFADTVMREGPRLPCGEWPIGQRSPRMQSFGAAPARNVGRSEASRCRSFRVRRPRIPTRAVGLTSTWTSKRRSRRARRGTATSVRTPAGCFGFPCWCHAKPCRRRKQCRQLELPCSERSRCL